MQRASILTFDIPSPSRVPKAMNPTEGSPHRQPKLPLVDLGGLKPVNDPYGLAVGDQRLTIVAGTLRSAVRQSDPVARAGGDELAAFAAGTGSRDGTSGLARELLDAIASPFIMGWERLGIGASMGIARFPSVGPDGEAMNNKADQAMYQAKLEGGHRHDFFERRQACTEASATG